MNEYRVKKERERLLRSVIYVFSSTALIFIALWIIGLLEFEDFNNYSGPVKITFGIEDGSEDLLTPVNELTPPEETPVEPEPEVEPEAEEVVEDEPVIDEPKEEVIEKPVEKPEESTPKEETPEKPIEKPVDKPSESKPEEAPKPPNPKVQKGEESGNSHETTFDSSSSNISRSIYAPINLYMPLPKTVSRSIVEDITGDINFDEDDPWYDEKYNIKTFLRHYTESGSVYSQDGDVDLNSRPELWLILESAGYNLDNAEYKKGRNLKAVIISFEIGSLSNGRSSIKSAELESSSGDKEIDEAVLYGFKRSTYSNSTDEDVKGRFRYSFN